MILKTYLRLFTDNVDNTLALVGKLVGHDTPDMRFKMPEIGLDIAAIGDILIVGGEPDKIEPFRTSVGPLVVDDLDATHALLIADGAEITSPIQDVPTGRNLFARHSDGNHVEYVQWTDELVHNIITR